MNFLQYIVALGQLTSLFGGNFQTISTVMSVLLQAIAAAEASKGQTGAQKLETAKEFVENEIQGTPALQKLVGNHDKFNNTLNALVGILNLFIK